MRIIDPSAVTRPESVHNTKERSEFRNFEVGVESRVRSTYAAMHRYQTYEFVQAKRDEWLKLDRTQMTILEALDLLNELVDESDPDIDLPNIVHAFQTAEKIRETHPERDWFHLVGLIHDLGKVMALWGEPQWATVGDTFPVGCAFSNKCVFAEQFEANPDSKDSQYSTKYGVYEPRCGLNNVVMSWGHDEYLYSVLVGNGCTIPPEGLSMVRFHSFYPWHSAGAYEYLMNDEDEKMLEYVREFNEFDLYTKCPNLPDIDELKPYYQSLIDKYCPGKLRF
ncbi:inositol oxygenase-like isoform X2 [Oscarella lobularis]|uniref:inositol oxygenase-like isoform X2 n=1 Tax=Oscarella lobularis TaxID=121494 RepID=UPI003313D1AE